MTANQLMYFANREKERANRATEMEQFRSNKAKEAETLRSNLRNEQLTASRNKAQEFGSYAKGARDIYGIGTDIVNANANLLKAFGSVI